MGSGRSIVGSSQRAYRVVKERKGDLSYFGPYSTLSAARGKATTERRDSLRWDQIKSNIYIEQTPEGWEKVEN